MKKIIAFILLLVTVFSVVSCGSDSEKPTKIEETMGVGASPYKDSRNIEGRDIKYVEICFQGYGKCVVLLDATTAPVTVENFITLVKSGFYDGLKMHRIITNFMIQGGDPDGDGTGGNRNPDGSKKEIYGEFSSNGHPNDISHIKGVISMARSGDPDSASSQFFICNADASSSLDGKYAAFGYVVEGLSVIDDITKAVFPKTAYAEYYGDNSIDEYYGVSKHYIWSYLGNGAVQKEADKPVIKYIKVLENY